MKTDKSGEMPKDLITIRDTQAQEYEDVHPISWKEFQGLALHYSRGFDKCYELMRDRENKRIIESNNKWEKVERDFYLKKIELEEQAEKLKSREQKLLDVIKIQNETLHYFASEFRSAREALAKVEAMLKEIGVGK